MGGHLHPRADDTHDARTYISGMTDAAAADPTAPSPPILRRGRWVAPAVIAVVVALSAAQHPAPSLTGRGLGVSLSLIVVIGATAILVRSVRLTPAAVALTALMFASASLAWLQPDGAGDVGLFVAVALAGMRLPDRQSVLALGLALGLAAVALLAPIDHASNPPGTIAGTELGIIAFSLVARFGRSAAEAHRETRRLLLELQSSRDAEAEAAMLRERSRLARDMHDVLAHSLSGLMLQLEGARMLAAEADPDGRLPQALDRAHRLARTGLEEARHAIGALRDADLPGPDKLGQLTGDFEHDTNVQTTYEVTGAPRDLDSETSLTIYRVAQEALTNVRKHARSDRVAVSLRYDRDGTRLIVDDQARTPPVFDPGAPRYQAGYGLTGMRERAELLGGSLRADPTTTGFRVELWIPS